MADDDRQYCLRWNNHQTTLISVFDTLFQNENLVDCTLAAEGRIMKAHKVVLSACSPYFATLLQEQYDKHPIFILKDVKFQELRAMMDYMYRGEVNISQDQLAALLKAAESLQIKGLSDNRTGGGSGGGGGSSNARAEQQQQPQQQHHHRGLNVPGSSKIGGGYTIETQSKRARVGAGVVGPMDTQDMSASREGSSSPSRRRRKVRRRSIENAMGEPHDNSNSSQQQQQQQQQPQSSLLQSNVNLAAAAVASALASQLPTNAGGNNISAAATQLAAQQQLQQQQQNQQMTSTTSSSSSGGGGGVTKKTENVKGTSDAMNTENVQVSATTSDSNVEGMEAQQQSTSHAKIEKQNHKQKIGVVGGLNRDDNAAEPVIEPKSEYDDDGNDETCEDLTLDDMGMDDLDQNAGTSQGGEGSSQGYAWPHERSQDELLLSTQEAQQRDPQVKLDKSEQTDVTPEEFELDDCLLESNDIVITQNKDGFVLHVKKLGNITTAKIQGTDDEQSTTSTVLTTPGPSAPHHHQQHHQAHITEVQEISDVKPTLTTLTTSQSIKLPSAECELINLKKIIPCSTTISAHPVHTATIIQPQQLQQHHQLHQETIVGSPHHAQVQSIVTTHPGQAPQTINIMGLRNVQIQQQQQHQPEQHKPILSRIKYSRGKIITPQGTTTANVQIVEQQPTTETQHVELSEGTKYEINEIDLSNPNASAAMISDLVKYAEIDDIELPDGTKIGIGFAPSEITEHMQTATTTATITAVTDDQQLIGQQHHHHHEEQQHHHHQIHIQHHEPEQHHQHHHIQHHTLQLQEADDDDEEEEEEEEQDDGTTSVDDTIIPDSLQMHEVPQPTSITKSYTILTTHPVKQEICTDNTTTYELSLSDSLLSSQGEDIDSKYICRHCGKRYRWKSTLRRHENVECGGKEPCHPCPYCSYKAKQRGNLGVHVRKHHPDKPQLESKRGRKM